MGQAPPSMKAVAQSFELLTTCIGNIIDIFLIEIKLSDTLTGEYFILSFIMLGATGIFILLAYFYYEYVPEDAFSSDEYNQKKDEVETEVPTGKALEAGEGLPSIETSNPAYI